MALAVASKFIDYAVVGKNLDRLWDLVAPELRAGITRKQWDSGELPVVPFPVRNARCKLEYSDSEAPSGDSNDPLPHHAKGP